jgi:hypothetical protein
MIPILLPALEQHGRLQLGQADRDRVLAISAATIDRLLVDLSELTRSLAEPPEVVASGLERLLQRHEAEWSAFTRDLGERSFVRKWIDTVQ